MRSLRSFLFRSSLSLAPIFLLSSVYAQSVVNTSEGILGDVDRNNRSPVLSVRTEVTEGNVKILAHADVPGDTYDKYPQQFDFFINRRLFSSQYRSPSLDGPVGVDVGSDVATPPFNYVVVVKVLHPNRTYTSLIEGAAFSQILTSSLDCTFTTPDDQGEAKAYVANGVETTQPGEDQVSFDFVAESGASEEDESSELGIKGTITIDGDNAKGTLSVDNDGSTDSIEMSGTVEFTDNELTSLDLASSDGESSLRCS